MKKNIETKVIPSPMPFYIGCGIMILLTFILPMYKLSSWLLTVGLGICSIFGLKALKVFKDQVIEIEKPKEYISTEVEELVKLGVEKVTELKHYENQIENIEVKNDLKSIIETSELILEYLEENQKLERDVRKYFRYYLDEIVNMAKHYVDFEDTKIVVDNIKVSKEKIEATLQNASVAFNKYYNDLYAGKAMDVHVDLKVFDSMLKELG